jgi:hypothetical protein
VYYRCYPERIIDNMGEKQKNELENELADAILRIIGKHITTGIRDDGYGRFLDCSINFNFLHNLGGLKISNLIFESNESSYVEESK